MYACMSRMEPRRLEISDDEFDINFNFYKVEIRMRRSFDHYRKLVRKVFSDYARLRDRIKNEFNEDKDEVFHIMIVQFRYDLDDLYDEFITKHGKEMTELEYYALCVEIQKENIKICDRFVNSVTPLMTYNLFDKTDPRNLIKACPYCGLVWWRTEGCDGATNCGTRVSEVFESRAKSLFKYTLKWIDDELTPIKNPVEKLSVKAADAKPSTTGFGCGNRIIWSNIPKLDDKILLEIFEVETIAEVRCIIQNDEYRRVLYGRESDSSFWGSHEYDW
ncbi:uncharacterized protein LOC129589472 [Paramacrobiotus metropolitanus]|uniref:uncharacterized protein LOC129589472 n=1 Tax=Paramacrobiotus metropolitanus TaxID=2943436 RepID=UPI002445FAD6|nr:uncharacterized protein LOC129589472 [Paramacrobiotus metropolitanus]XP_055340226.1 uncharacterized protein LOC129589472 [Paramacrobiotus metropolitanus]